MTFFNDYKIDGSPIIAPDAEVSIEWNDLDADSSGRDESGVMHRKVLRHRVPKWGLSYSVLTKEELVYMRGLFAGKATFAFSYVDESGKSQSCEAYCSNDSVTWYDARNGVYKNYKINIIAC